MGDFGFISDKLEVKFLILYIAARVVRPVPFAVLQELSMCDSGVDYFAFSECLADLVRTEHLAHTGQGLYAITEKGRRNSAICESSLPYSVRMQVDAALVDCNEQLRRGALVQAQMEERPGGGWTVSLSLSDELDELISLRLLVPREDMARAVKERFQTGAEALYTQLLSGLLAEEAGGT